MNIQMRMAQKLMSNSKRILSLVLLTPLICSCSNQQIKSFFGFDTVIQTKYIGNENLLDDITSTINKLSDLCDAYTSIPGTNNAYSINNSSGTPLNIDSSLKELIDIAIEYKTKTENVFNPFIKDVAEAWKVSLNDDKLPDSSKIEELNNKALSTSISYDGGAVLLGEGKLDFGGIAKGYLLSKIKPFFINNNVTDYIFDAGQSSILLGESSVNDGLYSVGIYETGHSTPSRYLKLKNICIGTSSIYEQKYVVSDGKTYSHCINGQTGSGEVKNDMVVVLGDDPVMCDVYSTVGMVSTIDKIKEIEKENPIKFLVFSHDKITYQNPDIEVFKK